MAAAVVAESPVKPNPLLLALARYRQRDYDDCIQLCTQMLVENPYDQAVWLLKCRALTARGFVDDLEWDEQGLEEALLDDNSVAAAPRPGTSLMRPGTSASGSRTALSDAAFRPMTASGRPATGFARPGTSAALGARPTTSAGASAALGTALRGGGARAGTARVLTSLGRAVRVGTASLLSAPGGPFIDAARLDLRKYAARPPLAKALMDYLLFVDADARRALELGALCTTAAGYSDWWWKERLGRAYFALGLLRDAEKQWASALRQAPSVTALHLQLARVYLRLDQPAAALDVYGKGAGATGAGGDPALLLGAARVQERLGRSEAASGLWRRVLQLDPTSMEAVACLAAQAFYADQPEVAMRHYRRLLLQRGAAAAPAELWADLGLACFHSGQLDLALPCFERALSGADDDATTADLWFNISTVAISCGDIPLAQQALRVALAADGSHAEAHTNLGALEARRGNADAARAHYAAAQRSAPWLFEPWHNAALLAWRVGDAAQAFSLASKALEACPGHTDTQELLAAIREKLG